MLTTRVDFDVHEFDVGPPSSSGLGHHPLKVAARVQIPLGVQKISKPGPHGPASAFSPRGDALAAISVPEPSWSPHLPEGCTPGDLDLTEGHTLVHRWVGLWTDDPRRRVLHDPSRGWITGEELEAESAAKARRLAALGVARGDRVLLGGSAGIDLVTAHVACLRSGAVVVPTNPAYREAELTHLIGDAEPVLALTDDASAASRLREADPSLEVQPLDLGPGRQDPDVELDTVGPESPALIGYTSGTTGRPKGAVLSHANLLAGVNSLRVAWRWSPDDRLVLSLPLFHMHGLGVGLHGTLAAGASAVLLPRFETEAVLDAVVEHRATMFFGVPTMYNRLAGSPRAGLLGDLRLLVSGSAPLPASMHHRIEELTGRRVVERYGMTETIMLASNPVDGDRRAGTVGFALPGVDLRLEEGTGEVLVRGPNVFSGYWRRPDANSAAFESGWFRTGDVGSIDSDGYLTLIGRAKELIISGGYNVYPREIEDTLRSFPGVAEVAVIGIPSEEWGEEVCAYLVPEDGTPVDHDELREFAASRLAPYKVPRHYRPIAELPRNALGKVQKHLLG